MNETMVQIASLTHRYGDLIALDNVSLDVPRSTIFGLLGPNGCGKTTLFRILTTLLEPTKGIATIDGADVVTQRHRARSQIGVVFQSPSLDGKLTVKENLRHQGHLYGLAGRALWERCDRLMSVFGVADRANDPAEALSGGLQRRVELAKAMLHEPSVLILDEPSTGLDPAARAAVMDYLHRLRGEQGVTCLITTHLMDEADRCDRIAILDHGKLISVDSPAALKRTIGGDVIIVAADDPPSLAKKLAEQFDVSPEVLNGTVRIERPDGHEFITQLIERFPGEINSITVGKPTLGDVFVHLTGHRLWNERPDGDLVESHADA